MTPKQQRFVDEYLIDLNATQAAIRAGYSAKTAGAIGYESLTKPEIAKAIEAAMSRRSEKTLITQEKVLERLWHIATADPNGLIEFRRTCCRHCWGAGHRHQYTEGEMQVRRASYDKHKADEDGEPWDADGMFDEKGGIGFDARRAPHPECPECHGEGVGAPMVKDTRDLSPEARALYAGVKITDKGLEVKMHDQLAALTLVGRHLSMFTDKVELSGKVGLADRLEGARRRVEGQ